MHCNSIRHGLWRHDVRRKFFSIYHGGRPQSLTFNDKDKDLGISPPGSLMTTTSMTGKPHYLCADSHCLPCIDTIVAFFAFSTHYRSFLYVLTTHVKVCVCHTEIKCYLLTYLLN